MSDPKKMSVEEILAACRQMDGEGGGGGAADQSAAEPTSAPPAKEKPAAPKESVATGKKSSDMSVEEMLAAARGEKGGGEQKQAPAAKAKPATASVASKKPGAMSVEEMLAAARGEKSKPAAKAPPKKAATSTKPAAAKKAALAAAKRDGPKDTASILAAARRPDKAGPISKAEAAAKGKDVAPKAKAKTKLEVPPMPAKPTYAKPAKAAERQEDRRGFLATVTTAFVGSSLAIGFSSLAVTNLLWLLGLARFMFPNILTEPPTKFKVGFPGDFGPGQVATKFKAQFGVWIARYEYEGVPQIYALQSVCTHLGCTPNWLEGEQKFKCPCHGSGFYKDGINFEGPAPRPLERFAIRVADDGQLEVDKSRKFLEEKGEWKDSASFVPV